ncbi:pentatricopeptide repeat-containing protein At1g50270 [Aristolochia californica]|uniref:pentatricopeptide repeat-containing protein At1g50270 n=1 Tax=Aristolochia californica TaxID=171875 RepID=UPI0035DBD360
MLVGASSRRLPTLYESVLSLLPSCKTIDHVKQIHCLLLTNGEAQDAFTLGKIVQACAISSLEHIDHASLILDRTETPNIFMWNSMMRGFALSSRPENSLFFFSKMRLKGVNPDKHTYPLLLKAFSKSKSGSPSQIHAQTVKFGLDFDPFVENALISAYGNCGELDYAFRLFYDISERDSIGWTAIIDGCVKNGRAEEGMRLFLTMRSSGVEIDGVTIVVALSATAMLADVCFGRCVHGLYLARGMVKWDVYVGSALMDMYAKCGHCDDARKVFDEMPHRNVVCWSALIEGYVQSNRLKEALSVFQDMLSEPEVKPNQATLVSVLGACSLLGALEQGRSLHAYAVESNLELNMSLGTSLIDMYAKCGSISEAFMVFHALPGKDVYPWTAMITGLAMHGQAKRSLDLFSSMLSSGVRPNAVTFTGVLCACSHGGLVDQGRIYFDSMSRVYGIEHKLEHYGCMVDLLGRSGHLEEALTLMEGMPMEPEPGIWGALFGACMIHKDFELGERIGKHLIKLQPFRSGRYSLLANLYSKSQKWEEAACMRKLMKGKGVEKTPGCSWIEVHGAVQEFNAFDLSCVHCKDIYLMLDRLHSQLSDMHQLLINLDLQLNE